MPRRRKIEREGVEPVEETVFFGEAEVEEFVKGAGREFGIRYAALRAMGLDRVQAARSAGMWLANSRGEVADGEGR